MASRTYVLIDEPELNLHASLQIDFLTTLASYASHGVLFTTHNLGLARAVANRIYSVRKIEMWRSEVKDYEETSRLTEFLGEMSFRGYKDLGYAAVLLVEGPTDLVALQQFLRLYRKEHTTVLLSMRDSNMINGSRETEQQLEEVTRISDNIYALIDSEKSEPGQTIDAKRSEFEQKCSAAVITCAILERRALGALLV